MTSTTKRYYTIGGVTVGVRDSATGQLTYLLGDQLGSTSVAVNASTGEVATQRFLPYGGVRSSSGTLPTEKGWIGQTKDGSTGLQYLNARYYDPAIGRFAATDPVVDKDRPISLDRYGYGDASPVTLSDPTGLRPPECDQGWGCSADSDGKWSVSNPPPPPKPIASSQPARRGGRAPTLTSAGAGAGTLSIPGFDDMYLRFGLPLQGPYEPGPCVKDNVMHFCLNEGRYDEAGRATMSVSSWRFKLLVPVIDPDSLEIFKTKNPLDLNGSAFSFRSRDVEEQAVFLSYMATDHPKTNLLFVNVVERTNAEYQVRRDDLDPEYGGTAAGTWGPYGTFPGTYEQVYPTMGFAITNGTVVG